MSLDEYLALQVTRRDIEEMLAKAARWFTPEMRLTFIARYPDKPHVVLVMGDDTFQGAIEALRYLDEQMKQEAEMRQEDREREG